MRKLPWWAWFLGALLIFFGIAIGGTLFHELGHYTMAVIFNQQAGIAYAYTYIIPPNHLTAEQYFWFIVGGPTVNWVSAIVGLLVILVKYRPVRTIPEGAPGAGQTLALIGVAQSIRFVFNAGGYLINTTIMGNPSSADEVKIANYLGLSPDLLMYGSALIALLLILIALYYIPSQQRYCILIGGIIGGALGYLFWYQWVGPIVLPLP
ncbi:MAG: hypothetical protein ACTSRS_02715 [Candidatus Helarchaeota archaeon]